VEAWYTGSRSQDDASGPLGAYPVEANPAQYYGPSQRNTLNRFSLTFNYELPDLNNSQGLVKRATLGWGFSGTSIFQSGYPTMVYTTTSFLAVCRSGALSPCSPTDPAVVYQAGSGDYNADGDDNDYPDVSGCQQGHRKSAFINGVFTPGQFTAPATFGNEGNETANPFRQPNFAETDVNVYKITHLAERVDLQLRFEFFNLFNRINLTGFDNDFADLGSTFGKATAQQLPHNLQVAARITFWRWVL
jgi:hypothetical protein